LRGCNALHAAIENQLCNTRPRPARRNILARGRVALLFENGTSVGLPQEAAPNAAQAIALHQQENFVPRKSRAYSEPSTFRSFAKCLKSLARSERFELPTLRFEVRKCDFSPCTTVTVTY